MKPILMVLLFAIALNIPATTQAQQSNVSQQIRERLTEYANELQRVNLYLAYYDQVQRISIATGDSTPADADARTRGRGSELYSNSFSDSDFAQLVNQHTQAASGYFSVVENDIRNSSTWAEGTSPTAAAETLAGARNLFSLLTGKRQDPLLALEQAARARANAQGQPDLTAATNPFAGQAERLLQALPDERARTSLAASLPPKTNATNTSVAVVPTSLPPPTAHPTTNLTPPREPDPSLLQEFAAANQFYISGKYKEGLPLYDTILERDPTFRQARFERGVMRTWTNHLTGALEDFRNLANDPLDFESRRLRAMLEVCAGEPAVARTEANKLLAERPNDPAIVLVAGQANLYGGDQARGQQLLQQARSMDPNQITGMYQQAQKFLEAGVLNIACVQFTCSAWADPSLAGAYYGIGVTHTALGQKQIAIEAYERYIELDSNSEWTQRARQALEQLKNTN